MSITLICLKNPKKVPDIFHKYIATLFGRGRIVGLVVPGVLNKDYALTFLQISFSLLAAGERDTAIDI